MTRVPAYFGVPGITTKVCPSGERGKCSPRHGKTCEHFAGYDGLVRINVRGFGPVTVLCSAPKKDEK